MRLCNDDRGYGLVTKILHWVTVAAIAAQFLIGWSMDFDDALDREEDRLDAEADRLEEEAERHGEAAEDRTDAVIERREDELDAREDDLPATVFEDVVTGAAFDDGLSLPEVHVGLGLVILALAAIRWLWRRTTPLPPWAEHLSERERRLEGWLEKVLLALLAVVPATGLLLVGFGDVWLPVHITAQMALLLTVAVHVGLVLKHTVVRRDRHLARML